MSDPHNPDIAGTPRPTADRDELCWVAKDSDSIMRFDGLPVRFHTARRLTEPEVHVFLLSSHTTKAGMCRYARTYAACKMAEAQRLMQEAQEWLAFADAVEFEGLPSVDLETGEVSP